MVILGVLFATASLIGMYVSRFSLSTKSSNIVGFLTGISACIPFLGFL